MRINTHMSARHASVSAILAMVLSIAGIASAPSPPAAHASSVQESSNDEGMPLFVGESLKDVEQWAKMLGLKTKLDSGGRMVIVKRNWIVIGQKPAPGKRYVKGSQLKLEVIKASEMLNKRQAGKACMSRAIKATEATTDLELKRDYFTAASSDSRWGVVMTVYRIDSDGQRHFGSILCDVTGTSKSPRISFFEVNVD